MRYLRNFGVMHESFAQLNQAYPSNRLQTALWHEVLSIPNHDFKYKASPHPFH